MDRREALIWTSKILGGTIVGSSIFLSSCKPANQEIAIIETDAVAMLDEIGETILPESDKSPGAKAARIGEFMKAIVEDCYTSEEAEVFKAGISMVNEASRSSYKKKFVDLTQGQKMEILIGFEKESRGENPGNQQHFYTMMKQLCIWGYFTSMEGATRALRYNPIPGRYDACIPYEEGQNAWS